MFKVRNKKVYNKTVRPRKAQPIVIERIENKSNVLSTIKKLDEVMAVVNPIVIAPVDATTEVIAPEVIEPEKIDVEEVMEVLEEKESEVEGEPKPKKPRKKAPKKEENNEE